MKVQLSGQAGESWKCLHCFFRELKQKVSGSGSAVTSVIKVPFNEQWLSTNGLLHRRYLKGRKNTKGKEKEECGCDFPP